MNYIFPLSTFLWISQPFKGVDVHAGVDFGWSRSRGGPNQPIVAIADGKVVDAVDGWGNTIGRVPAIYGNYVIIEHPDGNFSVYGHLEINSVRVKKGQTVKQGDVIGLMGNSGNSTGNHLHFEIRYDSNYKASAVNPIPLMHVVGDLPYVDPETDKNYTINRGKTTIGEPEERNVADDQIRIFSKTLRARASFGLKATALGICEPGIYTVIQSMPADGYTWYKTAQGFWCANLESDPNWGCEYLEHDHIAYDVTAFDVDEGLIEEVETFLDNHQLTFCTTQK